jgi:exopolysaccharide biosynthesis polyprenyl glycosylphosphotransferase
MQAVAGGTTETVSGGHVAYTIHENGSRVMDSVLTTPVSTPRPTRPDLPTAGRRRLANQSHISDHEHAAALMSMDFLTSAISIPIGLAILAVFSHQTVNSFHYFVHNMAVMSLMPVTILVALAISGSYRSARRALQPSTFSELKDLMFSIAVGGIIWMSFGALGHFLFDTQQLESTQVLMVVLVACVLVVAGPASLRAAFSALTTTRVIVVGTGALAQRVQTYLGLHRGMKFVGRVSDLDHADDGSLGIVADLPRICADLAIDRLIITQSAESSSFDDAMIVYRKLQESVHLAIVPRYFELVSLRSRLTDLFSLPLVEIASPHLGRLDRAVKRAFDISIAGTVLFFASPILAFTALAIRLSSPGPILFRQNRIGRYQRPFSIMKFRTMHVPREELDTRADERSTDPQNCARPLHEARKKIDESDRVTKVGKFLRRTGIDELPQLLNVLRGDMSIVGPRPFIPNESTALDGWASRRFEVRPGITGLWQVSGRNDLSVEDLRQLDYLYVASWSIWYDFKIVWDTPRTMINGLGAY